MHNMREALADAPSRETVGSALAWAVKTLKKQAGEEAYLEAGLLLAHALNWTRSQLIAHPERHLNPQEKAAFIELVQRRSQGEPLAYILGHWEFYGLDFLVDRRVLIPRPETELLVELTIAYAENRQPSLRSATRIASHQLKIADVGTGSGAIAVSLAKALPNALIYGLDISSEALEVATMNCRRHGVTERVSLLHGDLLAPLRGRVDCIVANLPYVSQEEWITLPSQIREYEPRLALNGGVDGLFHIQRLLAQAADYLESGGAIFLEIGATQGMEVLALARRAFPDAEITLHKDLEGHDRVIAINTERRQSGVNQEA